LKYTDIEYFVTEKMATWTEEYYIYTKHVCEKIKKKMQINTSKLQT